MPRLFLPAPVRPLAAGQVSVEVSGSTVGEALEQLELRCPGVTARLCVEGQVRPGLQVSVDGAIAARGLRQAVQEDSEIHFLPALGGG